MTTIIFDVAASSEDSDSLACEDFESDSDYEELNAEEILKTYQELLEKFVKVHTLNKSLKAKICDPAGENKWLEEFVAKYKTL